MDVLSLIPGGMFMLILTRKPNESLIIDNEITLTIMEVRGNQVRIGVDAPAHISIHREEGMRSTNPIYSA